MPKENKHYVTIFVESESESGKAEVMEPHKTTEITWATPGQWPEPLFSPLKNFLEGKKYP